MEQEQRIKLELKNSKQNLPTLRLGDFCCLKLKKHNVANR